MTPKQQQIAIAEACGWVHHNMRPSEMERHQKKWRYVSDLPDYLNDLNAMHEAEKAGVKLFKSKSEREEYWNDLEQWLDALTDGNAPFATAAHRAEAFLRTIGLWKE